MSFINIEVNNLRKTPALQLKESNSHLRLYLLNEQILREKDVLGQTCHGLDNQKWPEGYQGLISPYKFLVPCLSVRVKITNQ